MGEKNQTAQKNPMETLAELIVTAQRERLYVDQQDMYPMESQRAARILPAIEEDIERRFSELRPHEIATAQEMAKLMASLPEGETEPRPQDSYGAETLSRDDLLEGLDRIANDKTNKGEQ